jgi:hypothetical protein
VRHPWCICLYVLILGAVCSGAQQRDGASPDELFGTWAGSWEGGGSGGFELTLEKGKDGAPGGRVSVTGEPTYKATLKTLSFDGRKMTATYDFPPDDQLEIGLAATFDGDTAKGTWSAREKGGGSEVASGTWTVNKK